MVPPWPLANLLLLLRVGQTDTTLNRFLSVALLNPRSTTTLPVGSVTHLQSSYLIALFLFSSSRTGIDFSSSSLHST